MCNKEKKINTSSPTQTKVKRDKRLVLDYVILAYYIKPQK